MRGDLGPLTVWMTPDTIRDKHESEEEWKQLYAAVHRVSSPSPSLTLTFTLTFTLTPGGDGRRLLHHHGRQCGGSARGGRREYPEARRA